MYGYGNSMFLATHGILARTASGGGIDPDAQAFITAASITDPTQQGAINQLVLDLKGYSIWTKFDAIYPMVGGTSTKHSYNLRNTANFQLTFSGGWTHSATGAKPNGTNAYANTGYNVNTNASLNSHHLSYYSRTNSNGTEVEIGVNGNNSDYDLLEIRTSGTTYFAINSAGFATYSDANSQGFYVGNRTASNVLNGWKNGTKVANATTASTTKANANIYIGALLNLGSPLYYSIKECAFSTIGQGLTDTEAANFYTAVQAFQTTLGRSIGTQTVSDADAQAFVTNAGIVDQVEANAINNLVIGLKADSLWTKMKAVYPFVGGTSTTMKWNLKDPRDLDAAYRIQFIGGGTWGSTGYTPNGTNGYADTKLAAQGTLGLNSTSYGVYSRTNVDRNAPSMGNVTGAAPAECSLWLRSSNTAYLRVNNSTNASQASTDSRGLFIANRASSTQINLQIRGTQYTYSNNSNSLSTNAFQIGGVSPNFFDTKEIAFSFIGDGLTSQNMTDLDSRVTTFQTALNRNI